MLGVSTRPCWGRESTREQLAQRDGCWDDMESPADDDDVASARPNSMVGERAASSSNQVLSAQLPVYLKRPKGKRTMSSSRLDLKTQRPEHRPDQDKQVDA